MMHKFVITLIHKMSSCAANQTQQHLICTAITNLEDPLQTSHQDFFAIQSCISISQLWLLKWALVQTKWFPKHSKAISKKQQLPVGRHIILIIIILTQNKIYWIYINSFTLHRPGRISHLYATEWFNGMLKLHTDDINAMFVRNIAPTQCFLKSFEIHFCTKCIHCFWSGL